MMRRMAITALLMVVFFLTGAAVGSMSHVNAAQNRLTAGFYRSDFTKGIAESGPKSLSSNGYDYHIYKDGNASDLRSAIINDDVIFFHTHGSAGKFTLSSSVTVTASMIGAMAPVSDAELIYISACKTGLNGAQGNVCTALQKEGVKSIVAFKNNVSASTDTNGIHRFNQIVVDKMISERGLGESLAMAKIQILEESGSYWGADSYVIYGSGATKIN